LHLLADFIIALARRLAFLDAPAIFTGPSACSVFSA
jgi:hypothetical protein